MKKILVTGGCGHIGTNIVNEAIKRGHSIVAMDNLHREQVIKNLEWLRKTYTEDQFEFVWGDVRNKDDFDRLPRVDAIVHLAANPGIPWSIQWPTYDFNTNAKGTLNALEFARTCGSVPFVYASTNKTFSDILNKFPICEHPNGKRYYWGEFNHPEGLGYMGVDLPEGDSHHIQAINDKFPVMGFGKYGHSMYGISKLTGELYATEYHTQYKLPVVINKMSCIYGLFQKGAVEQGWISHFIQQCIAKKPITIFGTGKQVRDVLDARDVARLYIDEIEQIEKCDGEVFTVGGGPEQTLSLIEAIEEICNQVGNGLLQTFEPKRSADQDIYISSIKKVYDVLGWKPEIPIKQTIADMIKEYTS